ncbi:coiled-coil domain-containing protein 146 [Lingula anatina]|uniref:Coiled-coil domain-containing protein 146 n=1 Tax=Lingula anatina TaxID=7574 RepID=A0A1S3HBW2_LINAN|nr:coiled-coil domain-containing protein 146 [Lingula anatina]|eukprot:XP_013383517.1 coiled-coil domain-containing protein 146 [Lingula anatina]
MSDQGSDEDVEQGEQVMEEDEDREEDEQAYTPAISALPPKVVLQEESQMEVSASPAFVCLDELFHAGKLTGTRVAVLKAKYTELHDFLKKTRDSETKLLQQAKDFTMQLEGQKVELEKADNFPESYNTEVSQMRAKLLKYNNELAQAEDRDYQLAYKLENLEEEKKILQREYERLPKQEEIEKKIKELQNAADELRKEIAQRQIEAKNLREDLETRKRQYQVDYKDFEAEVFKMETLKGDLVAVNSLPSQIGKEADKKQRKKDELDKQKKELDSEYKELLAATQQLEMKRQKLEDEKFDMDTQLDKERAMLEDKQREYDQLHKECDYAKNRIQVLMEDSAQLDFSLRHSNLEKKSQHEVVSKKQRDKDKELRNLKKAELQFKVAEDALSHTKAVHEKAKGSVDVFPKDDGSMQQKRQDLQKEVDNAKRALAQENSLTAVEQVKVEQSIAEEEQLLYEQSDLRIEVVELTRLAAIKADEREQKARDFMRAEMRYHRAIEDLKTKQLQIQDHAKKYQEMQVKLKEFAKLYDVIKNERNKCVNLIQVSTQKAAEMREKIKILSNEIEILRTAAMMKERSLQKSRLKHINSIVIRDSLRNEVAKQERIDDELREKREQQKMDIAKLNMMINQAEQQMVELRKQYETSVQHRNDRGIVLVQTDEEVCIFYEKVNIQETMIRNGDVELSAREEEIRFLNMQMNEEKRAIELLRKQLPNKRMLDQELVTLQIQLSQCQDRMLELEKQLENPYDETRVRYLEGSDPSPAQLQTKLEELEVRLAEKEEQLLEKDLIFEQDTRLTERVKRRAGAGKDDTLALAKKVNDLQGKIKEMTRKMMAQVSELSMHQAAAMKLQQEVKEKEAELEQCYIRMEKGEPPSDEIEREWQRTLRDEERRLRDKEMQSMVEAEAEQYTLPGGITTAAEPRPNAYIPDDDSELPIPRPYGAHAPFKPQEPGSTMRHIRKPVPKPIEI